MIKIAAATALAISVMYAATAVPALTGPTETIEQTRGLKGDRLPARPSGATCADTAWPYYQGDCVRGRQQQPNQTPATRQVRIVATDRMPAGSSAASIAN